MKKSKQRKGKSPRDFFAACYGDIHFPWVHEATLKASFDKLHRDMTHVVQIGDLYDWYAASRFPRSHNIVTPEIEIATARAQAEWFWQEVKARAPYAQRVQLMGNHDDRPIKRTRDQLPELESVVLPALQQLYVFPGVTTIHDSADDFEAGGIVFTHGYLSRRGEHARRALKPVVRGHSHMADLTYIWPGLWELDVGFLGDPLAPVFGYSAWKRAYKMTRGLGIIDEHGPRFVPLETK